MISHRSVSARLLSLSFAVVVVGCDSTERSKEADRFTHVARLIVKQEILDEYAGTYELPTGIPLKFSKVGDRLMVGTPPAELLAHTSRRFVSNAKLGVFEFARNDDGVVDRVNYQLAGRDLWLNRIDDSQVNDPSGMVDAGGHQLRMLVSGEGGPTVVIEDGFGSSIDTRSEMHQRFARFTRVVSYDHAGTGVSEPGPQPRDAQQVAAELRTALSNAKIEPPFLLVGNSVGGDYIRVFVDRYPQDVAGIVLLDPTPDWQSLHAWMSENAVSVADSVRRIQQLTETAGTAMMDFQESARREEWHNRERTAAQARTAVIPPGVAVTQIVGAARKDTETMGYEKVRFFQAWLSEHVPHGKQVLAQKSGHAIFPSEPELVIAEVRAMVESARRQRGSAPSP